MGSRRGSSHRQRFVRAVVYAIVILMVLGLVATMASSALAAPRPTPAPQATPTPPAASAQASGPTSPTAATEPTPNTTTAATDTDATDADTASGPIVVLGTTGLSWATLTELAGSQASTAQAAAARTLLGYASANTPVNLVQRAVGDVTCPADAWLTIGSGTRTRASAPGSDCAWPTSWTQAVTISQDAGYGARPGALADALARAGVSTAAVGDGAGLALTSSDGTQPAAAPTLGDLVDAGLPDLTLVDLGSAEDPASAVVEALTQIPPGARVLVVSLADPSDAGLQLAVLPAGSASEQGGSGELLIGPSTHQEGLLQLTDLTASLLAATGAAQQSGSDGGRVDLPASTALSQTSPSRTPTAVVTALVDDAARAWASRRAVVPVTLVILTAALALVGLAAAALRRPPGAGPAGAPPQGAGADPAVDQGRSAPQAGARRAGGVLLPAACVVAALPAGVWLASAVPWWRAGQAGSPAAATAAAAAVTIAMAVVVTEVCAGAARLLDLLAARRRAAGSAGTDPARPWSVPALTTTLIVCASPVLLLADAACGAPLGFNGVLGMDAITAGRFYGMSNTGFALAGAGLLVALGAVVGPAVARREAAARRRVAVAGAGVPGLVALLVDASPQMGADVGGALTLIPALAALVAGLGGVRLGWRRWAVVALTAVGTVGALAVADYAAGSRTHLGRFATQVLDGSAGTTVARKATALVAPFVSSPLALTALAAGLTVLGACAWWLTRAVREARSGDGPYAWLARPGVLGPWVAPVLKSLAVLVVLEVLVNDSGVAMFWFSAAAAVPGLLAVLGARIGADGGRLGPGRGRLDPDGA
ncbi:MAG: hypothetical protein Q4C85_03620 [Actinomyces sp.]|uniref:hypothetical protein n=1 Tax=Actinomyces sp. TaxID=29317 RepID=UPI0026DBB392|nr:hypothetical protein [Actinomyces sp.]MDO4242838.1 hypothetical protein [Actinomyces sp.]